MTKHLDLPWIAAKQYVAAEEGKYNVGKLDRSSRELLDWIVVRCQSDKLLYVQEIVTKSDIASPATVYKSINRLREVGLVDVKVDSLDRRCRCVTPTSLSLYELKNLDKVFVSRFKK